MRLDLSMSIQSLKSSMFPATNKPSRSSAIDSQSETTEIIIKLPASSLTVELL